MILKLTEAMQRLLTCGSPLVVVTETIFYPAKKRNRFIIVSGDDRYRPSWFSEWVGCVLKPGLILDYFGRWRFIRQIPTLVEGRVREVSAREIPDGNHKWK